MRLARGPTFSPPTARHVVEAGGLDSACVDQGPLLLLDRGAQLPVEVGRPGEVALLETPVKLLAQRRVTVQASVIALPLGEAFPHRARRGGMCGCASVEVPASGGFVHAVPGVLVHNQSPSALEQARDLVQSGRMDRIRGA